MLVLLTMVAMLALNPKVYDLADRYFVWYDLWHGQTLFGRGLGAFISDFPALQVHGRGTLQLRYENAHNDFVQVIYELGIGGAVLIALLLVRMYRVPRTPAWYALVVFLLEAQIGFPLYQPVTGALAALCAGSLFGHRVAVRRLFDLRRLGLWAWLAHRRDEVLRHVGAVVPVGAQPSLGTRLPGDNYR